jgi:hypothetical protein
MDKHNSFLVIGNGPSVLDSEYGDRIDNLTLQGFNIVRFNNYQIAGYEKYVGSITHIQARRACDDVRLPTLNEINHVVCFVTYCMWAQGMQEVARDVKSYYGDACTIVPLKACAEIGEEIGLDQPYREWASVGILCLGWLTKAYPYGKILVHGFDGLKPNPETGAVRHYFHKPTRDAKYHNSAKELEYLKKLNLQTLKNYLKGSAE